MNLLNLVWTIFSDAQDAVRQFSLRQAKQTAQLVKFAFTAPVIVFLLGIALAAYGEQNDALAYDASTTLATAFAACVTGALLIAAAITRKLREPTPTNPADYAVDGVNPTQAELDEVLAEEGIGLPVPFSVYAVPSVFLGFIAYGIVACGALETGKALILFATIAFPLLMVLAFIRLQIIGGILYGATEVGHAIVKVIPTFTTDKIVESGRNVAGVMAMLTSLCVLFQGLHVWNSIPLTVGILTCVICLGFGAAGNWFSGKWVKKFVPVVMVIRIVVMVAMMSSSRVAVAMSDFNTSILGNMTLPERRLEASWLKELAQIQNRAVEKCGGMLCNGKIGETEYKDPARVAELQENLQLLRSHDWWQTKGSGIAPAARNVPPAAPTQYAAPYVAPQNDGSADLPPPPAAPVYLPTSAPVAPVPATPVQNLYPRTVNL